MNVGELHENERDIVYNILNKYKHEIQKRPDRKAADLPVEQKILLSHNVPVSSNPRRLPQALREEIDRQIILLREKQFTEAYYSPYAAHSVPVLKKDGSIRMCCDSRLLNSRTIPAKYPIPHIDDVLMEVRDSKIFSVVDLKSAYHQILIAKEDREKTACVTQDYKFQWIRRAFVLSGAVYNLAVAIHFVLNDCRKFAVAYYDDIIVHSKCRQDHLEHLEKIFKFLAKSGILINLQKSGLIKTSVEFLGHILRKVRLNHVFKTLERLFIFQFD